MLDGLDGALEIGGHQWHIQATQQCEPALETVGIVGKVDPGCLAPEDIGCNHHETIGSVLVGHRANMLVDTKNFLNQEQARATAGGRLAHVGIEFASVGTFY